MSHYPKPQKGEHEDYYEYVERCRKWQDREDSLNDLADSGYKPPGCLFYLVIIFLLLYFFPYYLKSQKAGHPVNPIIYTQQWISDITNEIGAYTNLFRKKAR